MNGLAMVWTRWTDRETNRAYIKSTEQIQSWQETGVKVFVSTTGTAPVDETTRKFIAAGAVHIPCHVGNPNHRLPLVLRKIFLILLRNPTVTHIGVVDDDALFKYPEIASNRINEVVQKRNPGAFGPIFGMRWWWVFRAGKILPPDWVEAGCYASLYGTTMFTAGCQIYSREALQATRKGWGPLFMKLIWRSDYAMFMMVRSQGYNVGEFQCNGYDHTASQAAESMKTKSLEWLKKRAVMLKVDAEETTRHFTTDVSLKEYLPLLHKTFKLNVNTAMRFAIKGGIPKEEAQIILRNAGVL